MVYSTSGRGRVFDSVLTTVGDTPAIRINRIAPDHVTLYVKAEAFNPGGSVKDRLALNIIEAAERDGRLKPGQTVVEATSGNTGIGLALVAAQSVGGALHEAHAELLLLDLHRLIERAAPLKGI